MSLIGLLTVLLEKYLTLFDKNIMGYTSRFERVILRAGAMLIFSVLFQF
jgi:hypothetical protein